MPKLILIMITAVLVLHGLIHLMGTSVYMKLAPIEGFVYKTTLLGGRWDLGAGGISLFGALWLVPALGFVVAAVGLWLGATWWQPLLLTVTLFSLVLTVLDWNIAFAGAVVNLVILALLWLGPRVAGSAAIWAR